MRTLIATLALATAASALPNHISRTTTAAATLSKSKGFYLTAHVTDPSHDLEPSVEGWLLGAIHTGAGQNAAVLSLNSGRLFYENGTAAQAVALQTTIATDGGTPPFPSSLILQGKDEPRRIADISVSGGTANAVVEDGKGGVRLVNGLGEGTYLACRAVVPYANQEFVTLQYVYGKQGKAPEGCAPIELVPRCVGLNELPEGSISSHEFAVEVACVA